MSMQMNLKILKLINPSRIKCTKKEKIREIIFLEDDEIRIIHNYLINHKQYSEALLCEVMYDGVRRREAHLIKRYDILIE